MELDRRLCPAPSLGETLRNRTHSMGPRTFCPHRLERPINNVAPEREIHVRKGAARPLFHTAPERINPDASRCYRMLEVGASSPPISDMIPNEAIPSCRTYSALAEEKSVSTIASVTSR